MMGNGKSSPLACSTSKAQRHDGRGLGRQLVICRLSATRWSKKVQRSVYNLRLPPSSDGILGALLGGTKQRHNGTKLDICCVDQVFTADTGFETCSFQAKVRLGETLVCDWGEGKEKRFENRERKD